MLYRTNAQSRALEEQFGRYAIAYQVIGGPKFYERAEIRDVIAYLTVLVNPDDAQRLLRIVNVPRARHRRDQPAAPAGARGRHRGESLWTAMRERRRGPRAVVRRRRRAAAASRASSRACRPASPGVRWPRSCAACWTRAATEAALEAQRTLEAEGRLENLEEFVGVAAEYDNRADEPSLDGFLQEISLYTDIDAIADTSELLTLMTLHNAKGLEFPVVFIAGMEEGVFPHQRSLDEQNVEEERRLAYVGITRAMERLYLVHARARTLWGGGAVQHAVALPGRDPRALTEKQAVGGRSTGGRLARRLGRRAGDWGGGGSGRAAAWGGRSGGRAEQGTFGDVDGASGRRFTGLEKKGGLDEEVVQQYFAAGERVLHATLGEGTVLAVQGGGIVLVRFDERRLRASPDGERGAAAQAARLDTSALLPEHLSGTEDLSGRPATGEAPVVRAVVVVVSR